MTSFSPFLVVTQWLKINKSSLKNVKIQTILKNSFQMQKITETSGHPYPHEPVCFDDSSMSGPSSHLCRSMDCQTTATKQSTNKAKPDKCHDIIH